MECQDVTNLFAIVGMTAIVLAVSAIFALIVRFEISQATRTRDLPEVPTPNGPIENAPDA